MNQNQQQYEKEQQQIISEAKHHIYELHNAMKKLDQNHIRRIRKHKKWYNIFGDGYENA